MDLNGLEFIESDDQLKTIACRSSEKNAGVMGAAGGANGPCDEMCNHIIHNSALSSTIGPVRVITLHVLYPAISLCSVIKSTHVSNMS